MNGFKVPVALLILFALCASRLQAEPSAEQELLDGFQAQILSKSDYETAKLAATSLVELGETRQDESLQARGLIRLAFTELHFGKWGNSFKENIAASQRLIGDKRDIAAAEYRMFHGYMLGKWFDELPAGIKEIEEAIWMAEHLRDDDLLARSYVLAAELHSYNSDDIRMMEYSHRANLLAEELDVCLDTKKMVLDRMCLSLHITEQKEAMLDFARRTIAIYPESGFASHVLLVSGDTEAGADKLREQFRTREARELTPTLADEMATLAFYIGRYEQARGNYDEAIRQFEVASKHYGISENITSSRKIHHHQLLLRLKQKVDSGQHEDIHAIVQEVRSPEFQPLLEFAADTVSEAYEKLGDFEEALYWQKIQLEQVRENDADRYRFISNAAVDYVRSLRRSREQQDLVDVQKRKSQFAYYLLSSVIMVAVSSIGIAVTWLRASRFQEKELARLVEEKTISLSKAKRKANAANEAKSEFLARVNHEIRNPLTAILAYCDLLEMSKSDDQRSYVAGLKTASDHLLELVDDVLVVSKIENDQVEMVSHEFDINETIQDICHMTEDRAAERGLALDCRLEQPWRERLRGDETKLRQIVLNLVSNAIKFADSGQVQALFALQRIDDRHAEVCITVTNSGPGVPDEIRSSLFEKFVRSSTNERVTGTGLGLHICKKLATYLGGSIDYVANAPLTTFVVRLPFEIAREADLMTRDPEGTDQISKTRVLIVDDQPAIRDTLRKQLSLVGFSARATEELSVTLETIGNWEPDVVLLDLRMPNCDGFEFLRAIRASDHQPRIVAMTGDATDEVRSRCEEAGFDGFLTKPFNIASLRKIGDSLSQHKDQLKPTFD